MSSNNSSRKVVSVAEQAFEHADETAVDEDGFEVGGGSSRDADVPGDGTTGDPSKGGCEPP